jgi:hypothetical protein
VSAFASTSNDFLVKPFAVERFEAALDLATSTIAHLRTEFAAEEQSLALYTPWLLKPLPYPERDRIVRSPSSPAIHCLNEKAVGRH